MKQLFWNLPENPLNEALSKHELYELLKAHAHEFSETKLDKIINWINTVDYELTEEYEKNLEIKEKVISHSKKEWLTALKSTTNSRINDLYNSLDKIDPYNIDHPGFTSWFEMTRGEKSPLAVDEVINKSLIEIINYFNEFNNQPFSFIGTSFSGLSNVIIESITKQPEKYSTNIEIIVNSSIDFKYIWIRGMHECWNENILTLNCELILNFLSSIFSNPQFWNEHNTGKSFNTYNWFVNEAILFIIDGIKDDKHAFEIPLLEKIKQILFSIYKNDKSTTSQNVDISMTVINSSKGRIFQAFILFSLRIARVKKEIENKWDTDIKLLFNALIKSDIEHPLLFFILGQYLPNIHYLDEKWMLENFNYIFPKDNIVNWEASIGGYLFYYNYPESLQFKLLKENNDYSKAIGHEFISIRTEILNNLVHQLLYAYLDDIDGFSLEDGLMNQLIKSKNKKLYSQIIYFFWSPMYPLDEHIISKIKPLWKIIYKQCSLSENDEIDKYFLSGCIKWLNHLTEIDDEMYNWVEYSAQYISQEDRYSVFEALSKHINKTPEKVAKILIVIFTKEVDIFSSSKISEMVEVIYQANFKVLADKICILHVEKGLQFLRIIYNKYNN